MKLSTGISKYIHEDVTDEDLASLYPSTTEAFNISPETHMGKITYKDENKEDKTVHFIDGYNSNDSINFGIEFLGLPTVQDLVMEFERTV